MVAGQWGSGMGSDNNSNGKGLTIAGKRYTVMARVFSSVALIPCEKIIMREKPKILAFLNLLFIIGITGLKHLRT